MARRHLESKLSRDELDLDEVWGWYEFQGELIGEETVRTLNALITGATLSQPRYFAKTRDELDEFFVRQRDELKRLTMFNLLAATEAALKVDYIRRIIQNKKNKVTKDFAALYKDRKLKVGLEGDILATWSHSCDHSPTRSAISEFKVVLNLRNWLAHGRFWIPRLARDYDPQIVFDICDALLNTTAPRCSDLLF